MAREELIRRLSAILPGPALLHEREDLKPFECDGLTAYQRVPMLVALPEDEDQVRAVLRVCHEGRVPVVFRGAGTGLSGGALPYEHGLLLVMSKLKRILDIDQSRTAQVQPGVQPRFPRPLRHTACITRPIRRARSRVRLAATSPKTLAACIA
jgi:glycolate oxidase